jgi:hypothetical protein
MDDHGHITDDSTYAEIAVPRMRDAISYLVTGWYPYACYYAWRFS